MSVVGVPMLLGPILGPVIGGLIVDTTSWRWIFYVNVPIAALALVLAARLLHADAGRADAGRLDWLGLALLSPGLAGIVFGLSESESHGGFSDPLVLGPDRRRHRCSSRCSCATRWRAERPLIDVRLFRDRVFAAAAATTFLLGGALFGAMIILPLYYQVARGESALTAGLLMAPQGFGAAMAMPLAGRLTDRLGGGRVAVVGLHRSSRSATIPFAFLTVGHLLHGARAACSSLRGHRDRLVDDAVDGRRLRHARRARRCRARRARSTSCSGSAARSAPRCWRSSCRARSRMQLGGAGRRRRRDARAAARRRARARGRAAGRRVRQHVLVGGRDVGARAHPGDRARGDAAARARRAPRRSAEPAAQVA